MLAEPLRSASGGRHPREHMVGSATELQDDSGSVHARDKLVTLRIDGYTRRSTCLMSGLTAPPSAFKRRFISCGDTERLDDNVITSCGMKVGLTT